MSIEKVTASIMRVGELAKQVQGDPQVALAMIEQVRGGAARRIPIEAIKEIMAALLQGMPYVGYKLKKSDTKFFRGRKVPPTHLPEKSSEIRYRSPDQVKEYGRCHCPGTSMFYCSSNLDTVLAELAPEVGDRVCIGVASVKESRELTVSAIGEIDSSRRYGRPVIGNQESYRMLNETLKQIRAKDNGHHMRILVTDAFFAELFAFPARKQYEYRPTSVLADLLLKSPLLDGFAYPSVEHRGGINYAIRPRKFDELMEWEEFMVIEVVASFGFGLYQTPMRAKGTNISEDGNISWEKIEQTS
jgi:hypothetical protein